MKPLHKGLDPGNLEQLITPLTTLGHLALLAPEQFAAPLKSLVANFIVKDLLMNDRVGPRGTGGFCRGEPGGSVEGNRGFCRGEPGGLLIG